MPFQRFSPYLSAVISEKCVVTPSFPFWISIAPDMTYLSHKVIIWEKILSTL